MLGEDPAGPGRRKDARGLANLSPDNEFHGKREGIIFESQIQVLKLAKIP
jgi:hypothetical protein